MDPKGGGWSRDGEKWRRGVGPMGNTKRERARALMLDYSEPNRADRSRPDGEKLAAVLYIRRKVQ